MKHIMLIAAGVASLTLASAANAADMPVKAPPPVPVVAAWSWTGFYGGVHVGSAWGQKEWTQNISTDLQGNPNTELVRRGYIQTRNDPSFLFVSDSSHSVNGFLGGLQAGFNYQTGWWVWGVEAQYSFADIQGKGNCGLIALFNCSDKVDGIGTAALRLGFAVDHALIFVKGGFAWAHDEYDVNLLGIAAPINTFSSLSDDRGGWMWGAGVEYMFTTNWSAKVEYNYMDFGSRNYAFPNNTRVIEFDRLYNNWDIDQRMHLVKFGVNYHFNWWAAPVVARY